MLRRGKLTAEVSIYSFREAKRLAGISGRGGRGGGSPWSRFFELMNSVEHASEADSFGLLGALSMQLPRVVLRKSVLRGEAMPSKGKKRAIKNHEKKVVVLPCSHELTCAHHRSSRGPFSSSCSEAESRLE